MTAFKVASQNVWATKPKQINDLCMSKRLQLCWKCQCDKPAKGGKIKMLPGLKMFICKDCVEKTQKNKATGEIK